MENGHPQMGAVRHVGSGFAILAIRLAITFPPVTIIARTRRWS